MRSFLPQLFNSPQKISFPIFAFPKNHHTHTHSNWFFGVDLLPVQLRLFGGSLGGHHEAMTTLRWIRMKILGCESPQSNSWQAKDSLKKNAYNSTTNNRKKSSFLIKSLSNFLVPTFYLFHPPLNLETVKNPPATCNSWTGRRSALGSASLRAWWKAKLCPRRRGVRLVQRKTILSKATSEGVIH